MKRTLWLILCELIVSSVVAGEGFYGAWARSDAPERPCLVFTNSIAWTLSKGVWRPSDDTIHELSDRIGYRLIGEDAPGTQVVKTLDEYERKVFSDQGVKVEPGAVGWFTEIRRKDGGTEMTNLCRIVRAKMPSWKKVRQLKRYPGVWKLTSGEAGRWRPEMIKIRSDGRLVYYFGEAFAKRSEESPMRASRFRACEGGIRLEISENSSEDDDPVDPVNECVEGLWLNPQGELIRYPGCAGGCDTYVRTDAAFADPLDAREAMVKKGAISGIWGVSSGFTIFVLSFYEDGRGILSGFMTQVPFRWKTEKQRLHCVLDSDFAVLAVGAQAEFDCSYDVLQDQMTVKLPADAKGDGLREMPTELPRMLGEITKEQMDEFFKRVEELKRDPQFKMEIERMKLK